MRHLHVFTALVLMLVMVMLALTLTSTQPVTAQDVDVGTPPVIITPGEPLGGRLGPEIVPTLGFNTCYPPLPIAIGDVIYIEPGVNIRSAADFSSAIVWNTSQQQVDEEGNRLPPNEEFNVEAFVVGGPICMNGYNWWQVNVSGGNDGWVAEGRPNEPGAYYLRVPGLATTGEITCTPPFAFDLGENALVTQNVRVREQPNTDGRVQTVVPSGTQVQVLSEPECDPRTGLVWFLVRATVVNFVYTGWISQGANGAIWLLPTDLPSEEAGTLCGSPLDFAIGTLGYVNSFDRRARHLRNAPGLGGGILYLLVDGVPFEFIGGPVCANNLNWWQVRVRSSNPVEGWIAEGSRAGGYWLSPTDPDEYAR
ncbi:MAG: SH3 domain-containing protein [Anaerolineae bacterium]